METVLLTRMTHPTGSHTSFERHRETIGPGKESGGAGSESITCGTIEIGSSSFLRAFILNQNGIRRIVRFSTAPVLLKFDISVKFFWAIELLSLSSTVAILGFH